MSPMHNSSGAEYTQALNLVPMVVEQSARGERAYDIYSRLLKEARYIPGRTGRR